MQLKHLTDDEIQEYLDGNLSKDIALLMEEHLETCPLCQEALKQYESLYADLKSDEGFGLSRGFARSVIKRLPAEGVPESRFNYLNIFLTFLGLIVAVGGTLYYVDLRPLGRVFSHILLEPLGGFEDLLVSLNGSLGLVALAILIFVAIGGLDRLIFQPRYKRLRF